MPRCHASGDCARRAARLRSSTSIAPYPRRTRIEFHRARHPEPSTMAVATRRTSVVAHARQRQRSRHRIANRLRISQRRISVGHTPAQARPRPIDRRNPARQRRTRLQRTPHRPRTGHLHARIRRTGRRIRTLPRICVVIHKCTTSRIPPIVSTRKPTLNRLRTLALVLAPLNRVVRNNPLLHHRRPQGRQRIRPCANDPEAGWDTSLRDDSVTARAALPRIGCPEPPACHACKRHA